MDINIAAKGAAAFAPIIARPVDRLPALRAQVAHHIPGRLRLRSPLLKDNPRAAEEATRRLAEIEGLTSVTANPDAGSLLVRYDPTVTAPDKLLELLANQGHICAPDQARIDPDESWADRLANVVTRWLIDTVAEHLALAVIGALT
ncbi:MAG: cation transporter [Alphaproteobacteria bacterium]|nr:cation transporter [Alphaproteobacteria bacterium]